MLFGMLIPMICCCTAAHIHQPGVFGAWAGGVGVAAYRWDTVAGLLLVVSYLKGEIAVAYTSYKPSLVEWLAGLAIISYGLLAFSGRNTCG
jgi:hypothetical protein